MKIAVVDDDKAICEAIAQLIKNQESEAEVCQFSSGKEMLETGENFAISFLDIAMEEMSGLELAGKLRQEQERKGWVKSILIFITGYRSTFLYGYSYICNSGYIPPHYYCHMLPLLSCTAAIV